MRLALTGGAACGKSTAAAEFSKLGWKTLSTDALAHAVLNSAEAAAFVLKNFGDTVFDAAGHVSRRALGHIVFNDESARRTLEAFIHPQVNATWCTQLAAAPQERWLVEIPLLFELGLEREFDATVCVHCVHKTQLARLAARALPPADAAALVAAQLPLSEKVRRSDFCIFNEGTPEFLAAQCAVISARA